MTVIHPNFQLVVERATGDITLRDAQRARRWRPASAPTPADGPNRRRIRPLQKESPWKHPLLSVTTPPEITMARNETGITLRVRGRYPRPEAPGEALEGELSLAVKPNGLIEIAYDYTPVNAHGLLLEAGLALTGVATATEFQWVGQGPYAGYPSKDALNEFSRFHLDHADLNFSGNRRGVELAALVSPTGAGVLLIPDSPADVAVEDTAAGVVLSHNAVLAGRGTKFVGPDTFPKADTTPHVAGRFTLLPLRA